MKDSLNYKVFLKFISDKGQLSILDLFDEFRKISSNGYDWYELLEELSKAELKVIDTHKDN